ncbi:hypothetical protein CDAR_194121 [Caerostris darwini]|uniref:Uncharacterized protein n=1 Tax=Caerostris darwini TaxID=1538125 RepID=A0AAV4NFD4_9ARAC|nr:hypothetical protein CDAR_194121 [Caerostris darwini]
MKERSLKTMVYRRKTRISKPPIRRSPTQSSFQRGLDPVCNPNEFGLNYGKIELNLGGKKCIFENGDWMIDGRFQKSSVHVGKVNKRSEELTRLIEENNFLKLKVEVLLVLLSEIKVKSNQKEASNNDGK